ncbi:MAG: L-histidine N(alpha)-methyltransferase [Rhizomicrobium sp.]
MSLAGFRERTAAAVSPAAPSAFARDFLAGLRASPMTLPCKYFYDREGSLLFERICELPEYYPTRTELALLRDHAPAMADCIGPDACLIEYGAGALTKAGLLLDAMRDARAYAPVDISGDYLGAVSARFRAERPGIAVLPVIADFTRPFTLPPAAGSRRVGFFPGSTIGNFERRDARAFLRRAAHMLEGGGLLIGVDLVKDPAILHAAYNDAAGVTEAFNKNILARANRELDSDFDLDAFAHSAFYEPRLRRIEMHLVSLAAQRVPVCGRTVAFAEGDAIHTENSHKYTVEGFQALAREAGFTPRAVWCDAARLFSVHWLDAGSG